MTAYPVINLPMNERRLQKFLARFTAFGYGVVCYAIFLGTFLYVIGFIGDLVVPKSIDSGLEGPLALALLVDSLCSACSPFSTA